MENLKSKIAVVTGASSGIGACIVRDLLKAELIVIALARRIERVEELKQTLASHQEQQRLHTLRCDVTSEQDVAQAFKEINDNIGPIYILINNAGCLRLGHLCQMSSSEVMMQIQTNIMGVVNCTRHAFASMQQNNNQSGGHIILINSILGHHVPVIPGSVPLFNIYPATKYALTAINEVYRQEFRELGSKVKVTSISPGLVNTELVPQETKDNCGGIILQPEDVSRAIMFVLSSPSHVQIYEMIIKPAGDII